ncbi:glycosyltransferase family 2 protein [Desulfosporosinus nitroreducens]|uniref:glycosyltransferase family 2 protein n=1 Tax=Desulfosporosinus nitroreducens TaxID=2018668 RepID=UPI00207CF733|nr:glycosyltransferase [Desulfosporosinus nitroreducens]MCO1600972.1 glycosyltransferase [Desulfosporosinus nitroreducens]
MPIISVIVPVYNGAKYLGNCLSSIQNQVLKDIEIILIDDGSTDESARICDELSLQDKRIKVLHQQNSGVSAARNAGIEISSGEYIGFVDCDDEISEDMYEILLNNALKYRVDISSCGLIAYRLNARPVEKFGTNKFYKYNRKEAIEAFLQSGKINISVCTKIFKRNIVQQVRFEVGKKMNEDKFFIFESICVSNGLCSIDISKYKYHGRIDSATNMEFTSKWFDAIYFAEKILVHINLNIPELGTLARANLFTIQLQLFRMMTRSNVANKFKKQLYTEIIRSNIKLFKKHLLKVQIIEYFLLKNIPYFYPYLLQLYSKYIR